VKGALIFSTIFGKGNAIKDIKSIPIQIEGNAI